MSSTEADRNGYAAGALVYDGLGLFVEDPLQTTDDVTAPGGEPVAITMSATGDTVSSSQVTFTLTVADDAPARWQGLYVGAELRRTIPLKSPLGPGVWPFVSTITIA